MILPIVGTIDLDLNAGRGAESAAPRFAALFARAWEFLPADTAQAIRGGRWRAVAKDNKTFRPQIDFHPMPEPELTRVGPNLNGTHFNSDLIAVMDDEDVMDLILSTLAECFLIAVGVPFATDRDREESADRLAKFWKAAGKRPGGRYHGA